MYPTIVSIWQCKLLTYFTSINMECKCVRVCMCVYVCQLVKFINIAVQVYVCVCVCVCVCECVCVNWNIATYSD